MVVYVLLEDTYITMHSSPEPAGVAVSDRSVAEHWASKSKFRSFSSVEVFETGDELEQYFKTERETREARISDLLSEKTQFNPPITDRS